MEDTDKIPRNGCGQGDCGKIREVIACAEGVDGRGVACHLDGSDKGIAILILNRLKEPLGDHGITNEDKTNTVPVHAGVIEDVVINLGERTILPRGNGDIGEI